MIYINIFSFLVTLIITGYWLYVYWPFYFKFKRTFWYETPHALILWMTTSGNRLTSYGSAKVIFTIRFRNQEKLDARDDSKKFKEDYK